jgi:hypothetical protein
MEFIRAIINNPKKLQEYNEYLEKAQPRLEETQKKEKTKIKCEVLRSKVVNEEIKKSLTEEQVAAYEEEGISAIFPTSYRSQLWKPDRAEWSFIKFAEPEVVATSPVIYSKGGMENQIVAAVSYGKLFLKNGEISNYSKDISQDSLFCQPDLVGITKIGRDGISTYFVVMPLDAIKFSEEKADTEKGEKDVYIFLNGNKKSTPIYEYSNGEKKKMFAINTRKIQPETMDGYVKVLFSDTYLQGARQFNGGYAGYITKSPSEVLGEDDGKPKYQIVTSDVGMVELEGTRFAFNNPGISALSYPRVIRTKKNEEYDTHRIGKIYGERNVSSLEKVCEELATEHLRLVKDITSGEFDFSGKEDAKTSEKPEGPEGQEPFED